MDKSDKVNSVDQIGSESDRRVVDQSVPGTVFMWAAGSWLGQHCLFWFSCTSSLDAGISIYGGLDSVLVPLGLHDDHLSFPLSHTHSCGQ